MKKLLLSILFLFSVIASFSQSQFSGIVLYVTDSATYRASSMITNSHSSGKADMCWNAQATTPHWDFWTGAAYEHVFTFAGGGGGGTPGGATTQVQFNNAGAFGGDADFLFTGGNLLTVPLVKITSGSPGANKVLTSDADGDATWVAGTIGAQDLFITGPAMWPTAVNGCSNVATGPIGNVTYKSLDFDQSTDQNAQFQFSLPRNWNNGTITVLAWWTATGSGSGTVQFEVSAVALSNDDPFSTSFGTAVAIDDTLIALDDVHATPISSPITIGGSPADGDLVFINIMRDVSDDTLSTDAKLLGVRVTITLDAATSE